MSSKKSQNSKRTYKKKPKATVKDIAKKVRKELAEVKRANPYVIQNELIYQYLPTNAHCNPLVPVITQGAGQGQRIGNSVHTRKAMLHLKIDAVQIAGTPAIGPNYFDIYIYKYKPTNVVSAIDITRFLQYGNTAVEYDGAAMLYCGQLEQNRELYTPKYHKRVTLWNAFASPNFASNSNAPSGVSFSIDITKYLKTDLIFNDTVSTVQNDNLFVSIMSTAVDGRDLGASSVGKYTYAVEYQYDDM